MYHFVDGVDSASDINGNRATAMLCELRAHVIERGLQLGTVKVVEGVANVELQDHETVVGEGLRAHEQPLGTCACQSELAGFDELACEQ